MMFENAHVAAADFLHVLIELMEEEFKAHNDCCYEMMYRRLFVNFLNSCCLKTSPGECYKKFRHFWRVYQITARPKMFLIEDLVFHISEKDSLIIGEVKRRKESPIKVDNFSIVRDLGQYDILGQHGGELLVELSDSCFRKPDGSKLIFGAICVGTQIIFTALEMKQEVYEKITGSDNSKDQIETDLEKSYIYYTRPYDILKSSDMNKLYKP